MPRRDSEGRRGLVFVGSELLRPWTATRGEILALPAGLAPALFPQTTGCFSIQLRERNGLPSRSRQKGGSMKARLRCASARQPSPRARTCGEGWWEALVTLQSSLPVLFCDSGFTDRQPERLPEVRLAKGSGAILSSKPIASQAGPPSRNALRRDSLRPPLYSERRLVGSGGNAPLVTSDFVF